MNSSRFRSAVAATVVASLLAALAAPAQAGTLTGTATFQERIALPPDAVFEVVIEDIARADAPATVIGRQRLAPAGQPPFRFAIPYDDSAVTPRGRFALRATVRHRGELLFTTDTVTPVLDGRPGPVELLLVKVHQGRSGVASLRGTTWRLIDLQGATAPSALSLQPRRPVEIVLAEQENRIAGSGGCNLLKGSFQLDGEELRFGPLASTRMACPPPLMAFEQSVLKGLAEVRRWSVVRRTLLLQDATGRTLMVFQALGGVH